jgi:adenylate cyclase
MERDEAGTLSTLKKRRKDVLQPLIAKHHGRIVKLMGDGVLVEFASAVNAVECAVELQAARPPPTRTCSRIVRLCCASGSTSAT